MLGGIGTSLVSDALSDVSWYLNPNRDLIEQSYRNNLETVAGVNDKEYDSSQYEKVGLANVDPNAGMTDEEKAVLKKYGKL